MRALLAVLSPLAYLKIRHPLKRTVDRWSPGVACITGVLLVSAWGDFNLFGSSGLVSGINGLVQIISGFFITSLAAIATFNGAVYRIDDVFEGEAALLQGEPLTRRQFLCHLFAYLALASLTIYLAGAFGLSAATTLHGIESHSLRMGLRIIFSAVYFGVFGHIMGTTLIGLVFLSARLSRVSGRDRFQAQPRTMVDPTGGVGSPASK